MKKFTTVFLLTLILSIFAPASIVNAAVTVDIDEVCENFNSTNGRKVFGYSEHEFDVDKSESINVFDLIHLKKKYLNNEDGVTENTVGKLVRYLIGSEDTLSITEMEPIILEEQSESIEFAIANLMSHDFSLIKCEPYQLNEKPAIRMDFLGIDEYCMEHIIISNIASSDDLESTIATNEHFTIGVIENEYYLAPINREPAIKVSRIYPSNVLFDVAEDEFYQNNPDASCIVEMLRERLNTEGCEYTVSTKDYSRVKFIAKTENLTTTVIVREKPVSFDEERETILLTEDFEFYFAEDGYWIYVWNEYPPYAAMIDLTVSPISEESASKDIRHLKKIFESTDYNYSISVDSEISTICANSTGDEYSHVEIIVQEAQEQVGGEVILETEDFKLFYDNFGFGVIVYDLGPAIAKYDLGIGVILK
jgi:hypothetical protein